MILIQVYQATPYSLAPLCGHSTRVSSLGRRLQELVHQPAAHAGPVVLPAERAQAFFEQLPVDDFQFIPSAQGD